MNYFTQQWRTKMTLLKVVADKNIQPLIIRLDVKEEIGGKVV